MKLRLPKALMAALLIPVGAAYADYTWIGGSGTFESNSADWGNQENWAESVTEEEGAVSPGVGCPNNTNYAWVKLIFDSANQKDGKPLTLTTRQLEGWRMNMELRNGATLNSHAVKLQRDATIVVDNTSSFTLTRDNNNSSDEGTLDITLGSGALGGQMTLYLGKNRDSTSATTVHYGAISGSENAGFFTLASTALKDRREHKGDLVLDARLTDANVSNSLQVHTINLAYVSDDISFASGKGIKTERVTADNFLLSDRTLTASAADVGKYYVFRDVDGIVKLSYVTGQGGAQIIDIDESHVAHNLSEFTGDSASTGNLFVRVNQTDSASAIINVNSSYTVGSTLLVTGGDARFNVAEGATLMLGQMEIGSGASACFAGDGAVALNGLLDVSATTLGIDGGHLTLGDSAVLVIGGSSLNNVNGGTITLADGAKLRLAGDSASYSVGTLSYTGENVADYIEARHGVAYSYANGVISVSGTAVAAELTWAGTSENSVWVADSRITNWTSGSGSDFFANGDSVTFGAEAAGKEVTVRGNVSVNSMTVTDGYSFSGGDISVNDLTLSGNVAFNNGMLTVEQVTSSALTGITLKGNHHLTINDVSNLASINTNDASLIAVSLGNSDWEVSGRTLTIDGNVTTGNGFSLKSGGGVTVKGGIVNVGRIVVHNGDTQTNETFTISGGVVNVTSGSKPTGVNDTSAGILLGHWPYGSGERNASNHKLIVSGGVLNALDCHTYVGWDSRAFIEISGGEANFYMLGINDHRDRGSRVNMSGGRLNIGVGGIVTTGSTSPALTISGDSTIGTVTSLAWTSNIGTKLDAKLTVDTEMRSPRTDGQSEAAGVAGHITFSGPLSGTGALNKTGDGTLVLTNANSSYSGTVTVEKGTLELSGSGMAGSGNISVGSEGTVEFAHATNVTVGNNISAEGVVKTSGEGAKTFSGTLNVVDFVADSDITIAGTATISGSLTGTGVVTLDTSVQGTALTISGNLALSNAIVMTNGSASVTSGTHIDLSHWEHSWVGDKLSYTIATGTNVAGMSISDSVVWSLAGGTYSAGVYTIDYSGKNVVDAETFTWGGTTGAGSYENGTSSSTEKESVFFVRDTNVTLGETFEAVNTSIAKGVTVGISGASNNVTFSNLSNEGALRLNSVGAVNSASTFADGKAGILEIAWEGGNNSGPDAFVNGFRGDVIVKNGTRVLTTVNISDKPTINYTGLSVEEGGQYAINGDLYVQDGITIKGDGLAGATTQDERGALKIGGTLRIGNSNWAAYTTKVTADIIIDGSASISAWGNQGGAINGLLRGKDAGASFSFINGNESGNMVIDGTAGENYLSANGMKNISTVEVERGTLILTSARTDNGAIDFDTANGSATLVGETFSKTGEGTLVLENIYSGEADADIKKVQTINVAGGSLRIAGEATADVLNIGTNGSTATATSNSENGSTYKKLTFSSTGITGDTNGDANSIKALGEMSKLTLDAAAAMEISYVIMQDVAIRTTQAITYTNALSIVSATTEQGVQQQRLSIPGPRAAGDLEGENSKTLTTTAVQTGGSASGMLTVDVDYSLLSANRGNTLELLIFEGVNIADGFKLQLGDVLSTLVNNGLPVVQISVDGGENYSTITAADIKPADYNLLAAPRVGATVILQVVNVPEPATGALSVLALAALAARRRRGKKN